NRKADFFEPETAYWPLSPSRGRRNHPANLTEGRISSAWVCKLEAIRNAMRT
ncbi:MAG: hypothetical protein ACI957_004677, partial [Verrucomicrobiales bacterium]